MGKEKKMGECRLCLKSGELRDSHVIPDWVYKNEIRDPKGGSVLDLNKMRRSPHAIMLPLLCPDCEQKFGRWENQAKRLSTSGEPGGKHGPWLFWFAMSISWRNLLWQTLRNPDELSERTRAILAHGFVPEALECWRTSLLTGQPAPGSSRFRQYLFLVDKEYHLRQSITLGVLNSGEHVFVWSRFSFYGILGLLDAKDQTTLRRSEIKFGDGTLPTANVAPASVLSCLVEIERAELTRVFEYADTKLKPSNDARDDVKGTT